MLTDAEKAEIEAKKAAEKKAAEDDAAKQDPIDPAKADGEQVENEDAAKTDADDQKADNQDDEDDLTLTLSDPASPAEDEEDDDSDDNEAIKAIRNRQKEAEKRAKAAEKRVKELEAKEAEKQKAKKEVELGPKPTPEDFDYDDDEYDAAIVEWTLKKQKVDEKAAQAKKLAEKAQADYSARLQKYYERKEAVGIDDEAELTVKDKLSEKYQGIIIDVADDPATLILALSQPHNKKALEGLAGETNILRFTKRLALLEASLKGQKKQKPLPDTPLTGSTAQRGAAGDKHLDALEREADRTGDRTKVQAYKRQLKEAS